MVQRTIELSWDAVPGAASYRITYGFVGGDAIGTPVSATGAVWQINALQPGTAYWVAIAAVGQDEVEGTEVRLQNIMPSA